MKHVHFRLVYEFHKKNFNPQHIMSPIVLSSYFELLFASDLDTASKDEFNVETVFNVLKT